MKIKSRRVGCCSLEGRPAVSRLDHFSLNRCAAIAVLAAIVTSTTTLAQSDAVWQGGAGNWSSANWTINGPPNQAGPSGDAVDALIDNGNPVNSRVDLHVDVDWRSITLDSGDALTLNGSGALLTINSANNGGVSATTARSCLNRA